MVGKIDNLRVRPDLGVQPSSQSSGDGHRLSHQSTLVSQKETDGCWPTFTGWLGTMRNIVHSAFCAILDFICCKFTNAPEEGTKGDSAAPNRIDIKHKMLSLLADRDVPRLVEIFQTLPETFVTSVRETFKQLDPEVFVSDEAIFHALQWGQVGEKPFDQEILREIYRNRIIIYSHPETLRWLSHLEEQKLSDDPHVNRALLLAQPRWLKMQLSHDLDGLVAHRQCTRDYIVERLITPLRADLDAELTYANQYIEFYTVAIQFDAEREKYNCSEQIARQKEVVDNEMQAVEATRQSLCQANTSHIFIEHDGKEFYFTNGHYFPIEQYPQSEGRAFRDAKNLWFKVPAETQIVDLAAVAAKMPQPPALPEILRDGPPRYPSGMDSGESDSESSSSGDSV